MKGRQKYERKGTNYESDIIWSSRLRLAAAKSAADFFG